MTRISNSEQVLAIVRAQLQRMAKRGKADKSGRTEKADTKPLDTRQTIEALGAIEGLSDEDFARGLVSTLLIEEFGEQIANSPGFQGVVDRTVGVLREDTAVRATLAEMRGKA